MTMTSNTTTNNSSMDGRKRVRHSDSFGRMGVDRTISNSLKSPSRQKLRQGSNDNINVNNDNKQQLSVRFAEETPMIYMCSHFDQNMTPTEMDQRKKELWYTRNDFEEFLRERISTIRLLKVVQGDALALRQHCPDLCLRGLEPYQCDTLNQELQCQRQMHLRVVLTEQTLQKGKQQTPDPEVIRRLAQGRSEWARKRAQQLGSMDALEVKPGPGNSGLDDTAMLRRRSLASAQLGLENLMLSQRQQHQRRASLSSLGMSTTPRRVPVDMAILKEWNAKFLQDIRQKNGQTTTITPLGAAAPKSLSDKTAESRRALQRGFHNALTGVGVGGIGVGGVGVGIGGATGLAATGLGSNTLGYGELLAKSSSTATTSTASTTSTSNATTAPSFRFPVRRDSLVGLRRESFLATKQQAVAAAAVTPKTPASAPAPSAMSTLAAAAAAVSAGTAGPVAEACFRFPVRRDSLSNVHWN